MARICSSRSINPSMAAGFADFRDLAEPCQPALTGVQAPLRQRIQPTPLMDPMSAQPTNHQQHFLYAWRQKLVAALMHECALIPEGVSDVAWLEALQTALELHQSWDDTGDGASLLSTFVGVVPTIDAKIADTFAVVCAVHARPCILVDGDNDGCGYFDAVKASNPPPRCVVFWPQGWAMEHVVSWIASADEGAMLAALGIALGTLLVDAQALAAHLLARKSYAPTHESAAVILMAQ